MMVCSLFHIQVSSTINNRFPSSKGDPQKLESEPRFLTPDEFEKTIANEISSNLFLIKNHGKGVLSVKKFSLSNAKIKYRLRDEFLVCDDASNFLNNFNGFFGFVYFK